MKLYCNTRGCITLKHRSDCDKCAACCSRSANDCGATADGHGAEFVSPSAPAESKEPAADERSDMEDDFSLPSPSDSGSDMQPPGTGLSSFICNDRSRELLLPTPNYLVDLQRAVSWNSSKAGVCHAWISKDVRIIFMQSPSDQHVSCVAVRTLTTRCRTGQLSDVGPLSLLGNQSQCLG